MTHLLDTSAILSHYFQEPGSQSIQVLFEDSQTIIAISALTLFEIVTAVLRQTGDAELAEKVSGRYSTTVDRVEVVTEEIALKAIELRLSAGARIATVDVLIAATALHHCIMVRSSCIAIRTLPPCLLGVRYKKFCPINDKAAG